MGNHFVHRNALVVQTEHPCYRPGDRVCGAVYANVIEPFDCEGLRLSVGLWCMHGGDAQLNSMGRSRVRRLCISRGGATTATATQ